MLSGIEERKAPFLQGSAMIKTIRSKRFGRVMVLLDIQGGGLQVCLISLLGHLWLNSDNFGLVSQLARLAEHLCKWLEGWAIQCSAVDAWSSWSAWWDGWSAQFLWA